MIFWLGFGAGTATVIVGLIIGFAILIREVVDDASEGYGDE